MLTAHRGDVPVHLRLRKRDGGTLLLALGLLLVGVDRCLSSRGAQTP
jgi:hypothetical protein